MSWLDEWLFPRRCPVCLEIVSPRGAMICEECRPHLKAVRQPRCFRCGRQLLKGESEYCGDCASGKRSFERGIVGFDYDSVPVSRMIAQVKYHNKRQLLDYPCLQMAKVNRELVRSWGLQCLIPVPLHRSKQRKRGFNQAQEIAERLGAAWGIPVEAGVLYRTKRTKPQKELDEASRFCNLLEAFSAKREYAEGLCCAALVDDIFTTGSTMEACTRALQAVGVRHVYCISLASGHN